MNFRKTIAGVSALMIAAGTLSATSLSAFAAEGTDQTERNYTEGKIKEYIFAPDVTDEIDCRFYADKPNIPYVKLSDFYRTLNDGTELSVTRNEDGTYKLETSVDSSTILDTKKDILTTDLPVYIFGRTDEEMRSDSDMNNIFYQAEEVQEGESKNNVFDFGSYDIDIIDDNDGEIWWPLTTLTNTYRGLLKFGMYLADTLYFVDQQTDFTSGNVLDMNYEALQESMGESRPEDLVQYSYNELCRVFDRYYGFPGSIPLNDVLAEKGFDGMLETNDDTKLVKSQLLSENYADYFAGVVGLQWYVDDGGHTEVRGLLDAYPEEVMNAGLDKMKPERDYEGATNLGFSDYNFLYSLQLAYQTRAAVLGPDEEGAAFRYIKKGDTAMFSFDDFFNIDYYGWSNYYNQNGELPQDIITGFKACLEDADKDENIKNFIIDLSSNTGGYTIIVNYMMAMMGGYSDLKNEMPQTGVSYVDTLTFDKNFDRVFDEKDNEVKYDLNYGVITTNASFSSANMLPYDAKDSGFMLIGEKSGGGACAVMPFMFPEGGIITLSTDYRSVNKNGESVDLGIKPDYELVMYYDDGTKDYSKLYDFDTISKCFADYYGNKQSGEQPGEVTTTTVTTGNSSESTTTTAAPVTSEQTSSASTTADSSSASSSSTNTSATGELPQTGSNSLATVAVTFAAITLTATGICMVAAGRKREDEE